MPEQPSAGTRRNIGRRTILTLMRGGLLAAPFGVSAGPAPADATPPLRRLVALDYGLAETLLLLGLPPVGLVGAQDWNRWVGEPALPAGVVNLGSSREPNLELLQQLAPDAILSTPYLAGISHRLERIAPVLSFPMYVPDGQPLALATEALSRLAALTGRVSQGMAALAAVEQDFASARSRLSGTDRRPLLMVSLMDSRHVRIYGANSLFGAVLTRLDVANAYAGQTNFWGFTTLGIESLPPLADARLVFFDPVPPGTLAALAANPLWTRLPYVQAGRVSRLPPVLMFGALPSATRFARLLADALTGEHSHG
ncbi:ABC transporter substrate-binding protein [Azorhizobium caulinodans]|nr:ABC transporter substrate-binding protein [Azorhizobium caulinodans]